MLRYFWYFEQRKVKLVVLQVIVSLRKWPFHSFFDFPSLEQPLKVHILWTTSFPVIFTLLAPWMLISFHGCFEVDVACKMNLCEIYEHSMAVNIREQSHKMQTMKSLELPASCPLFMEQGWQHCKPEGKPWSIRQLVCTSSSSNPTHAKWRLSSPKDFCPILPVI